MDFFRLAAAPDERDPAAFDAALRRAWNACAAVACPKCRVAAWEHCRNRTAGVSHVAQFHKPRQDAANALDITRPVGIYGLGWAKFRSVAWAGQRIPPM